MTAAQPGVSVLMNFTSSNLSLSLRLLRRYLGPLKLLSKTLRAITHMLGVLSLWLLDVRDKPRLGAPKPRDANTGAKLIFFPYSTGACLTQHKAFAAYVARRGIDVQVWEPRARVRFVSSRFPVLSSDSSRIEFSSLRQLLDYLEEFVAGDSLLARGLIDSFLRLCPAEALGTKPYLTQSFLDWATTQIRAGREFANRSRGVVFGDSVYLPNRAIMSAVLAKGAPVWVINPLGRFRRVSESADEVFSTMELEFLREAVTRDSRVQIEAKNYLNRRYSGNDVSDFDSAAAFGGNSAIGVPEKKILFLHVFRDANGLPVSDPSRSLFRTYLEWADFVLSSIVDCQDDWAIKPHPSGRYYEGDSEILGAMLTRYGLENVQRLDNVPTAEILKKRLPVYTHSGTVALETATFGYQAFTCSLLFPREFTTPSLTIEQLKKVLRLPFKDAAPGIQSEEFRELAGVALYLRSKGDGFKFSPKRAHPDKNGVLRYRFSELRQQFDLFKLTAQNSPDTLFRAPYLTLLNEV